MTPLDLAEILGRDDDRRTLHNHDDDLHAWAVPTRAGVDLRIPPGAKTGMTITLDAYRRWDNDHTTTTKGNAA